MTGIDIGDQTVRAPRPCDAFLQQHHGLATADVDVLAGHATTCLDVECRAAMTSTLVMVVRQSQSASTAWERVLRSRLLTEMTYTVPRHANCHLDTCECECHGDPNQLDLLAVTE